MRRIGRQRGPLTRRIAAQGVGRSVETTWVARLNSDNALPAAARTADINRRASRRCRRSRAWSPPIWNSGFQVAAEDQPLAPLPAVDPLPPAWDYPGHFRKAAADHLSRLRPRISASLIPHITMSATVGMVREQMHPRVALANLARAAIVEGRQRAAADGAWRDAGRHRDRDDGAVVPAADVRGAQGEIAGSAAARPRQGRSRKRCVGLRTNRAFVEAYMIGLNVEMARELLWRGFPTDQQGTYFRHSGEPTAPPRAPATSTICARTSDVRSARRRRTRPPNQFVLLLRSSLLRRYPNAIIYLTPALTGTPTTPPPPTSIRSSTARWSPTSTSSAFRSRRQQRSASAAIPATSWSSRSIRRSRASVSMAPVADDALADEEPSRDRDAAAGGRAAQGPHLGQELRAHGGDHAPAAGAHHDSRLATRRLT